MVDGRAGHERQHRVGAAEGDQGGEREEAGELARRSRPRGAGGRPGSARSRASSQSGGAGRNRVTCRRSRRHRPQRRRGPRLCPEEQDCASAGEVPGRSAPDAMMIGKGRPATISTKATAAIARPASVWITRPPTRRTAAAHQRDHRSAQAAHDAGDRRRPRRTRRRSHSSRTAARTTAATKRPPAVIAPRTPYIE